MSASPHEFMASARSAPSVMINGNTPWAARYAAEIRRVWTVHAAGAERSLQAHLGPSEIGHTCARRVAGKLAHLPATNHVMDPWPSIRGTALHAHAEGVFAAENARLGRVRWTTERKVGPFAGATPFESHQGTADLYDADEASVDDHKFLGASSMDRIRSAAGPPRHYVVQLLLYALGYMRLGLPVRRVVLIAYPATAGSLDGIYVWEHEITDADHRLIEDVRAELAYRKAWAAALVTGTAQLLDVPADPADECHFCLAGETEVITRAGIRQIRDLAGGEHELLVPTPRYNAREVDGAARGVFRAIPVRSFGEQRLLAVHLRGYRATKVVYATAEHRWITPAGERLTTMQLRQGAQIATLRAHPARGAKQIPVAVAQGFTYGDGAHGAGRRPGTLPIYGRSEKQVMLDYFGPIATTCTTTPDGDKVTTVYGLPRFWKSLPPHDESRSFLLSWLSGYFAADGNVSPAGQATISSADRRSLAFVRDVAAVCGIGHGLITSRQRLGTGTEPSDLHSLDLTVRDLPPWFWVLGHHASAVAERIAKPSRVTHWSVVDVEPTDRVEEVFCATVPGVEAFALADGVTSGNCPFYRPQSARDNGPGCPGHSTGTTRA